MAASTALTLTRLRKMTRSGKARDIRLASGLSLNELATEHGSVGPVTIMRWEKGETTPRGDRALRYAAVLDRLERAAQ